MQPQLELLLVNVASGELRVGSVDLYFLEQLHLVLPELLRLLLLLLLNQGDRLGDLIEGLLVPFFR